MKKDMIPMQLSASNKEHASAQDMKEILEIRRGFLETVIKDKKNALIEVPAGTLRINKFRNKWQYYYREKPGDGDGVYISQDKKEFVQKLAQKSYDEKVLREAERESRILRKTLMYYNGKSADTIYDGLSDGRKELVVPIIKTTEQYVNEWNSVPYQGKAFAAEAADLYTDRGERVRSKSELIIANTLYRNGIPYRYEFPLNLKGYGMIYPDFTILNVEKRKEILWEHLGMMDDPEYAEKAVRKIHSYVLSGFIPGKQLILTSETRRCPLNVSEVKIMIREFCF